MKTYNAQILIDNKYSLAESPFFHEETGLISFVDIPKGEFFLFNKETKEISMFSLGQQMGSAVPMKEPGSYLLAGTDGLYVLKDDSVSKVLDTSDYYKENQRSNDAKCDFSGRLFFGSSLLSDGEPSGNLFCYDHGNVSVLQPDTKISNGMAWSKDRTKFYFSDSPYQCVFQYDYDETTGKITNRRELCKIKNGVTDGMCIDSDDNLWVAIWGGRRIEQRDGKTGELLSVINVAAENVTSCCFYGDNMDELFITTSGDGQSGPSDGYIFTCKVDATGTKTNYFEI